MAYEEIKSQIAQRRQDIEQGRKAISDKAAEFMQFNPNINQTYQQLLKASPRSQALVQAQEYARKQAKELGLDTKTIWNAVNKVSWKHI